MAQVSLEYKKLLQNTLIELAALDTFFEEFQSKSKEIEGLTEKERESLSELVLEKKESFIKLQSYLMQLL